MKNIILTIMIPLFLVSCGGSELEKKKAELAKLKKEQEAAEQSIQKNTPLIKSLEAEIAKLDTSFKMTEKEKLVAVTPVAVGSFAHSIDVQGRVDGDDNVTLSAKVPGVISRVHLHTGNEVRAGQVIAEIDNDLVRSQINDLKTSLALATDLFNKQKSLWDQKIGTEMQYLQSKNNKESLEAKLVTLNEQLDMYLIKSPINGTVDNVAVKVGQSVMPGIPCAQVVNFASLKLKADLSESYASRVHQGDEVEIVFPDIDSKSLRSKVSYVAQSINNLTRTFSVEIALPSEKDFRPNMIAIIRIVDYKKNEAIAVPVNTIQNTDNQDYVFVAVKTGNRLVAKKREVKTGPSYNGKVEILQGLQAGDILITTGYQDLNDNELIRY